MSSAIDTAKKIVAEAVNGSPSDLDNSASIHSLADWDSLAHMRIIFAIEEALGRTLEPEAIVEIESLDDIANIIRKN